MLRIELDRILEYLATGEEEALVTRALPLQPDASQLLAQARAAVELLSPSRVDSQVQSRLDALEDVILNHERLQAPFDASLTFSRFSLEDPEFKRDPSQRLRPRRRWVSRSPTSKPVVRQPPVVDQFATPQRHRSGERVRPNQAIALAVRAGDQQRLGLGQVLLSKHGIMHTKDRPPMADMDIDASIAEPNRAYAAAWAREPASCQLAAEGVGSIELGHEDRDGEERLVVTVRDLQGRPVPGRVVTLLPAKGAVTRTSTDEAGLATLPWPAPGDGRLRIDAVRTFELDIFVEV